MCWKYKNNGLKWRKRAKLNFTCLWFRFVVFYSLSFKYREISPCNFGLKCNTNSVNIKYKMMQIPLCIFLSLSGKKNNLKKMKGPCTLPRFFLQLARANLQIDNLLINYLHRVLLYLLNLGSLKFLEFVHIDCSVNHSSDHTDGHLSGCRLRKW